MHYNLFLNNINAHKIYKIVIYKICFKKLYTVGFCNADKNINKFNMDISNNTQSYIKYTHYVLPVNTFF